MKEKVKEKKLLAEGKLQASFLLPCTVLYSQVLFYFFPSPQNTLDFVSKSARATNGI